MIVKAIALWFVLLVIAFTNGALRGLLYEQRLGELRAHQLSSVTAVLLLGVAIWLLTGRWRPASDREALTIGAIWLLMTVAFEFLFGRFALGHSWGRLFHDYNLLEGRLWSLVLLWIFVAPWVFHRWRRRATA